MPNEINRLYSYVLTYEGYFAPNPFENTCTLACCKGQLRNAIPKYIIGNDAINQSESELLNRINELKDVNPNVIRNEKIWIIGLASIDGKLKKNNGDDVPGRSVIYIMQVTDILDYANYYTQYPQKRPIRVNEEDKNNYKYCGDNIYTPDGEMLISCHYNDQNEENSQKHRDRDEQSRFVLLSDHFIYFGRNEAIELGEPDLLNDLSKTHHTDMTLRNLEVLLNNSWGEYFALTHENYEERYAYSAYLDYEPFVK
jgi:hypothetical protein